MEALNKLAAEAGPTEQKVILGWLFNTRRLLISLPDNKATAWTKEIDEMLELGKASAKQLLERNIGRYVHITIYVWRYTVFKTKIGPVILEQNTQSCPHRLMNRRMALMWSLK